MNAIDRLFTAIQDMLFAALAMFFSLFHWVD